MYSPNLLVKEHNGIFELASKKKRLLLPTLIYLRHIAQKFFDELCGKCQQTICLSSQKGCTEQKKVIDNVLLQEAFHCSFDASKVTLYTFRWLLFHCYCKRQWSLQESVKAASWMKISLDIVATWSAADPPNASSRACRLLRHPRCFFRLRLSFCSVQKQLQCNKFQKQPQHGRFYFVAIFIVQFNQQIIFVGSLMSKR